MIYALIAAFVLMTILVESDWFGWALVEVLVIGAAAYAASHWAWVSLPSFEVRDVVFFSLGYFLAGVVWSFIRWLLFILNFRSELASEIANLKRHGYLKDEMSPEEYKKALAHLPREYWSPPTAHHYSGKISGWIGFWPCSVVGFILRNPVKHIFPALEVLVPAYG